ncbi:MAG: c-type cytochrome [Acidobacteria bacterium]|nr:c-type cytochrome [Acidobacteriota bacterium]
MVVVLILVVLLLVIGFWYYRAQQAPPPPARPIGQAVQLAAPLGLPPVPVPADNPLTADTIALGRRLYYDPILSVDNTVACATCHHPDFGFSDGKQFSEGVKGQKGTRNAPTVFNAAYYTTQFWDGRAPSLEKQAEGPVENAVEMAHTLTDVEKKLMASPGYREAFKKAFGADRITYEMVEKAIAAFERTIISGNSPFDHYFYGSDQQALSDSARRGLEVFRDPKKGNCTACHTIGENEALFTDNKFHNLGVGVKFGKTGEPELSDPGRYKVTANEADQGAFKTPSLRNIALTAPYMHDGSLRTLKDVVDFYVGGGNSNPHLDKEIHALDFLTGQERADLLAFLESLTGEMPPDVGPPLNK